MSSTLLNQETGESIDVDLASAGVDLPAALPATPVESGLPVNRTRYRRPTRVDAGILLPLVPTHGTTNDEVRAFVEDAARRADRLSLTIRPGEDPVTDLRIGDRRIEYDAQTDSNTILVSLVESRNVNRSVAAIFFPEPSETVRSGTEGTQDGGRQSPQDVDDSVLSRLIFGGG